MKNIYKIIFLVFILISTAFSKSQIWDEGRVLNIYGYDKNGSTHLGHIFTILQGEYFAMAFLILLIAVPSVFALHYMVIGPMIFSHEGKQIKVFSLFNRIIHWIAAVAFIILVPTGLIMVFGSFFGGGEFVKMCKYLHDGATVIFLIVIFPMFFMWVKNMFLVFDDIKWLLIFGGYLSKKRQLIPAGKFNSGQKTWFWLATLGGMIMIITGGFMYFLDFDTTYIQNLTGLSHIDLLRIAAITHNILGMGVVALFFVHIYMSMFAIKGSINSMIDGNKHEEEVKIMHSSWYNKLKKEGKI